MTSSLKQLIEVAREKFAFKEKDKLILMLEEDETEVQDEDYFCHIYVTYYIFPETLD